MDAMIRNPGWSRAAAILLVLPLLCLAAQAGATTNYGDFVGTNITYEQVQETSQAGDPEPLFGAPLVLGDQLLFFPSTFGASATGAGGADTTHSLLQTFISSGGSGGSGFIDTINLTELGDTTISGTGTVATNTAVNIGGFVTVLQQNGVPIVPVVIPFTGTFAPKNTFDLPTDGGATIPWSGSVSIDVASVVPNATLVQFSLDNQLDAFSELGSSATIQKKVVDGPGVVIEVPEPGTGVLLASCLLFGFAAVRRSRVS